MSIKGACPNCGTGGDISFFIADTDARKATLAAAKLPSDCGVAVIKYISLFSPANRFLTPGRYAKLITECCGMIIDGIDFDREHIKAPSYVWRQAMSDMVEKQSIQRPIKNHHYLLRMVQSSLNKRSDYDQTERAANRRNAETSRARSSAMKPVGEVLEESALPELPAESAAVWMQKARKDLIENHGIKPGAFMSDFMIESRAKQMHEEALK